MKDIRRVELDYMRSVTEYLASNYPQYFKVDTYEHPVMGVRISVTILPYNKTVDIQVITNIDINFDNNSVLIATELGNFLISDFIKDGTVI
jgi:hypothetical protein